MYDNHLFPGILKDADLETTSSKKVRMQLESILGVDLNARKKEIDGLVMDYVNSQHRDDSEEESESESESEEEKPRAKRQSASKKPAKKRKAGSSDNDSASDASEDDYRPQKSAAKNKKKKKNDSSDEASDDDWKKPKKAPAKKSTAGAGKGKGNGFTRPYTLSPELASIMGTESCPRHEVVKKMWAIIKERNLYDPKNKQYAICDSELLKVIGVKRFRTFGMLKYLKQHFID